MWRVAVCTHQRIGESHAIARLDYRRHLFEVDLVHNAVARLNHVNVLEGLFGPVNKMKTVVVTAVFDGAVLCKRIFIVTTVLNRQRVIHNQLRRHHRVDL